MPEDGQTWNGKQYWEWIGLGVVAQTCADSERCKVEVARI